MKTLPSLPNWRYSHMHSIGTLTRGRRRLAHCVQSTPWRLKIGAHVQYLTFLINAIRFHIAAHHLKIPAKGVYSVHSLQDSLFTLAPSCHSTSTPRHRRQSDCGYVCAVAAMCSWRVMFARLSSPTARFCVVAVSQCHVCCLLVVVASFVFALRSDC